MAKARVPDQTVKIAQFAKAELDLLVERLSTFRPDQRVGDAGLMGALVLAAMRSPIESVSAVLATYWAEEARVAAAEAVGTFLRGGDPSEE